MEDLAAFGIWLLDIALWSVFWFFVLKTIDVLAGFYLAKKETDQRIDELYEEITKSVHSVKVEKHNDTIYWFDDESDRFLAQGRNTEELIAHLKERFKYDIFLVADKHIHAGPEFNQIDCDKMSPDDIGKYIAHKMESRMKETK